jgi:hypothetical protein
LNKIEENTIKQPKIATLWTLNEWF